MAITTALTNRPLPVTPKTLTSPSHNITPEVGRAQTAEGRIKGAGQSGRARAALETDLFSAAGIRAHRSADESRCHRSQEYVHQGAMLENPNGYYPHVQRWCRHTNSQRDGLAMRSSVEAGFRPGHRDSTSCEH